MKRKILVIVTIAVSLLLPLLAASAKPQSKMHKVVFEMSVDGMPK